mgnify:CR=1 FL=1
MNRKEFLVGAGTLAGAALMPPGLRAATGDEADGGQTGADILCCYGIHVELLFEFLRATICCSGIYQWPG